MAELSVTVKLGKDYDSPWIVVKGEVAEVRSALIEAFSLEADDSLTVDDLTANASKQAQAKWLAVKTVGGVVVKGSNKPAATASVPQQASAPAEESGDEAQANPLLSVIEQASSVEELKRLYAEHGTEFNEETLAAWKARGKALTKGATSK